MNIELQTAIAIQYSIKILKSVHDSQQKNKNIAKKITKYWHNVRISEIGDIRFSRNFFPRRFPPFRTCTRNKLSLTCRQSLDHVTVTFLDALHKSAFFHQSFGRTLENTFASEKYKTLYISSISQGFPFSPLRVVVPSARIHALHTRCGGDGTGSRIIFSIRALRKIEFTQVGIRPWARMTIFSVIERREMLRELLFDNISRLLYFTLPLVGII